MQDVLGDTALKHTDAGCLPPRSDHDQVGPDAFGDPRDLPTRATRNGLAEHEARVDAGLRKIVDLPPDSPDEGILGYAHDLRAPFGHELGHVSNHELAGLLLGQSHNQGEGVIRCRRAINRNKESLKRAESPPSRSGCASM